MVSPDVVCIRSDYFVVYFRVCVCVYIYEVYVCPVYHYIAATAVYSVQRIIAACIVVL